MARSALADAAFSSLLRSVLAADSASASGDGALAEHMEALALCDMMIVVRNESDIDRLLIAVGVPPALGPYLAGGQGASAPPPPRADFRRSLTVSERSSITSRCCRATSWSTTRSTPPSRR